jgi:hypothetical protein
MRLRPIFIALLVAAGLLLSAFGALPTVNSTAPSAQITVTVPPIETLVVPGTVVVPVTGTGGPAGWTLIVYALLALLGIAFLLALFSPRRTHDHIAGHTHDHHDHPPEI